MKKILFSTLLAALITIGTILLREYNKINFPAFLTIIIAINISYFFYLYFYLKQILLPIKNIKIALTNFSKTKTVDKPMPKQGNEDMQLIISNLNKMMLELQAYNYFHLEQVIDERNKSQAIMDLITDAIALISIDGKLIHHNYLFGRLLQLEQNFHFDCKEFKDSQFKDAILNVINSPEKKGKVEIYDESSRKTYLLSYQKFIISYLKKEGVIVIIKDITLEKELEKAKEDFFHMITHDLRVPLSVIQGYTDILYKKVEHSSEIDKYFQHIIYSSKKAMGMVNDILNTMRLESGKMSLQLEKISANEIITTIRDNHIFVAQQKNIEIFLETSNTDFEFYADYSLLERVITNLVTNSLKFTPRGGKVTIGAEQKEDCVFIWVKDTGPGVPEEKKDLIFKKYVQMEEHRNMGFGLGLAFCKMAVELHKGKIWVESELGKGSKFIFSIPKKLNNIDKHR